MRCSNGVIGPHSISEGARLQVEIVRYWQGRVQGGDYRNFSRSYYGRAAVAASIGRAHE